MKPQSKKALSLVEVLVSIMLISVIIVSILQMKENNLHFLQKGEAGANNNAYISLVSLEKTTKLDNSKIYLNNKIDFKDDDIRRKLKKIKIDKEEEMLEPIVYSLDDYSLEIKIKKSTFSIGKEVTKNFYRFQLGS